jgi:hypothetical protein
MRVGFEAISRHICFEFERLPKRRRKPAILPVMPRLKSALYVQALIRRAEVEGANAYLVRRGAEEAGAVFVKLNRLDGGLTVLSPARRGEERVWMKPLGDSTDGKRCDDYFARQVRFDPDIWIVEIEDRQGRAFVDEPIV